MRSEEYDKYFDIVYCWAETKRLNRGVSLHGPRLELFGNAEFYVIGIGVPNFLEPEGFESDRINSELVNTVKTLYGSNWLSIDELAELSKELKNAGAKEVYIHPSLWQDKNHLINNIIPDEWLIVIPKE